MIIILICFDFACIINIPRYESIDILVGNTVGDSIAFKAIATDQK